MIKTGWKKKKTALIGLVFILAGISFVWFVILPKKKQTVNTTKYPVKESPLDIVFGNDSAQLTVFMYSSYNCVFCRNFFVNTFPQLNEKYIQTNKVRLIIKLVELSEDEHIIKSLKTAVCINKYGDFRKLHQLLLVDPSVVYTKEFVAVTEEFIEKDIFVAECMLGGNADNYLMENKQQFRKNSLTGTPTFIINQRIYKGYRTFDTFKLLIEKELEKSL